MRPHAKKRFGQHFLERAWVAKVIRAVGPEKTDVFVEIGPGAGALTTPLAEAASALVAVEVDRDLVASLRTAVPANVSIVEADFLELDVDRLSRFVSDACQRGVRGVPDTLRVAGNLPYNVASPVLFKLVELYRSGLGLVDAALMLQREVADRLLAAPGSRDYGIPSVLIRHSADIERLLDLPPGAFRPQPKVASTLVRLRFHADQPPVRSREALARLVRAVFTRRRKTLANALLALGPDTKADIDRALAQSGIDGRRRPETLDLADFVRLADEL